MNKKQNKKPNTKKQTEKDDWWNSLPPDAQRDLDFDRYLRENGPGSIDWDDMPGYRD